MDQATAARHRLEAMETRAYPLCRTATLRRRPRDNLDENGGGNQSLKAAAGSEVMIALGPAVRKHFFSVPLLIVAARQSAFFLDFRVCRRPPWTTLAVAGGAAAITLDIHLEDGRVMV